LDYTVREQFAKDEQRAMPPVEAEPEPLPARMKRYQPPIIVQKRVARETT